MASQQLFAETGTTISDAADAFEQILTGETVEQETNAEGEAEVEADEVVDVNDIEEESEDAADESEEEYEDEVEETELEDEDDDVEVDEDVVEEPEPKTVKLKYYGEEIEVPFEELKNGYSRTADYTKKTQVLAEQRKTLETELAQVQQERAAYSQLLDQLQAQVESSEPEPDWNTLYESDPIEWVRQREVWRAKAEQKSAIQAERQRMQQMQEQEQAAAMQATLAHEAEAMSTAIPEWSDAKIAAAEKAKLREYGMNALNFSEAEMSQVYDHRAVVALRKAMLYDELMASGKPKAKAKVQKALKPGSAATTPKPRTRLTKAKQRLAKTGSVRDAASAFEYLLNS